MSKVLIVGGTGLVGSRLLECFEVVKIQYISAVRKNPNNVSRFLLDLSKFDEVPDEIITECKNVVFLAGITSPDLCETSHVAHKINVVGTNRFIERCLSLGSNVLFFSSDAVYGVAEAKVDESQHLRPIGKYGAMKMEVEKEFGGEKGFKALRLSYVLSNHDKFLKYIAECAKQKRIAEVYGGFLRSVIWIDDVIETTMILLNKWNDVKYGVINVGGAQLIGREDIAASYKNLVDRRLKYCVRDAPNNFYDHRAAKVDLNIGRLMSVLGKEPIPVASMMQKITE